MQSLTIKKKTLKTLALSKAVYLALLIVVLNHTLNELIKI